MKWELSEEGNSLTAFSKYHDGGTPFEYEVVQSEDGSAVLTGTAELFDPADEGTKLFPNVIAAIRWAEARERDED
jgi:hypothetical protein